MTIFFVGLGGFPTLHTRCDDEPRNGSKVYIGEYATRHNMIDDEFDGFHVPHVGAAMEDASFLISMERNSDVIIMSSYAPLFCNVNDYRWTPNAIYFDGLSSYATPAWWVQHLFSTKRGNIYIPTDSDGTPNSFFHSAALNNATNTVIIKVVNNGENAVPVVTDLMGTCSTLGGMVTVLTGARFDSNSLEEPMNISPVEATFTTRTNTFNFNAPAYSLTIFEIQLADDDSCQGNGDGDGDGDGDGNNNSGSNNALHKYLLYSLHAYVYAMVIYATTTFIDKL